MGFIGTKLEKILVTGSAGFIGMHLCQDLLKDGYNVCGIDNLNDYYSLSLKESRLKVLLDNKNFEFKKIDISNLEDVQKLFENFKPDKVVNLAAQAGVRYSLLNPHAYIQSNIVGFTNIIETCKEHKISGLIYASSSSVYGQNKKIPFSVHHRADKPISIYAASKISNELIAYTYSHLYGLHTTGLRFFTVYGPWGRPDMAMYIFAEKIKNGEKIFLFNHGRMQRDFTYIDDIIKGIRLSITKNYLCEIFNLGNNQVEELKNVIQILEDEIGKKANIENKGMQLGDVKKTFADIEHTKQKLGYSPRTSIIQGIPKFIDWLNYYNLKNN